MRKLWVQKEVSPFITLSLFFFFYFHTGGLPFVGLTCVVLIMFLESVWGLRWYSLFLFMVPFFSSFACLMLNLLR